MEGKQEGRVGGRALRGMGGQKKWKENVRVVGTNPCRHLVARAFCFYHPTHSREIL